MPPRPDGLHPAPPVPPVPPRPDAVDRAVAPPDGAGPHEEAVGVAARPKATWSWYEAVGVYILGFLIAGLATIPLIRFMEPDTDLTNIVLSVVAALAILGVLVAWLSMYHKGWVRIIGLPAKGEWGRQAGAGLVSGLVLFPVITIVVGGIVSLILRAITGNEVQPPEQVGEHLSAIGTAITVVYAFVIAPVGEELFFRGVLFRAIRDRHGFWAGAVGSAFAFGLIHFIPGNAADAALLMIAMFFTGLGLCYIYERRGTLVASIAAHVTFNVIGIVLIFGMR
jgi:membrane protease YdiL (CAAX protease family)